MYNQGLPGTNRKYIIMYPKIEMPWAHIKAFFLPIFLDIQVTTGITIKVVPKAPKHPNRDCLLYTSDAADD